jgi:hypothetical protein
MAEVAVAEKPKAVEPKVEKEAPLPVLPTSKQRFSITESGYAYAEVDVTQPIGHTVTDALRPEYWVHHTDQLKARPFSGEADRSGAILRLRTDDHAHFATLYVRAVGERGLIVQQIGETTILGLKAVDSKAFTVRWNVGKRGFDIIRNSDSEIVGDASKFSTKEQAQSWINETTRAA